MDETNYYIVFKKGEHKYAIGVFINELDADKFVALKVEEDAYMRMKPRAIDYEVLPIKPRDIHEYM